MIEIEEDVLPLKPEQVKNTGLIWRHAGCPQGEMVVPFSNGASLENAKDCPVCKFGTVSGGICIDCGTREARFAAVIYARRFRERACLDTNLASWIHKYLVPKPTTANA